MDQLNLTNQNNQSKFKFGIKKESINLEKDYKKSSIGVIEEVAVNNPKPQLKRKETLRSKKRNKKSQFSSQPNIKEES